MIHPYANSWCFPQILRLHNHQILVKQSSFQFLHQVTRLIVNIFKISFKNLSLYKPYVTLNGIKGCSLSNIKTDTSYWYCRCSGLRKEHGVSNSLLFIQYFNEWIYNIYIWLQQLRDPCSLPTAGWKNMMSPKAFEKSPEKDIPISQIMNKNTQCSH